MHPNISFEVDSSNAKVVSNQATGANIDISLLYPANGELLVRKGFNANPLGNTTYPSFRQKVGGVAKFYTLLLPKKDNQSSFTIKPLDISSSGVNAFELDLPTGKGLYIHNPDNSKGAKIDRFFIEAEFAYIQLNRQGDVDYAVMLNGRSFTVEGKNVEFVELSDKSI